ncbi:hemagglutinin repeat-containing protein [Herbaspirillum sp. 1130]|uniref:two-partner secretion domain-containing protein n=1 Tax=Herbaspirillum sp. 1130 TaxID=2806562 RepID=UPI001B569864|nr:filamentous hemagglutinin [Herbaspirillum sp. 1130]
MLVLAGAQLLTLPAAQAQIVADPSAPRSQQAVVVTTANGLPQVNITTPSAAGVSRNTYSQFDVNKPGAILNNARNDVQTRLGGWIQRNPNLATGTAGVILNEVNSANPSFLRGYVEVAGDRAQVIIANPSGVTCDGCGFINASRTTLTTGTAIMNNGNLDGFVVRRGTVTVQGEGLDSSQSDYTHIIARAVRINAGLWSRDLRITTGANRVNADNQVVEKLDGEGDTPSLSIDVAQLGGMYANKIVLVGTEAGVGVRNAGTIGAAAGEVRISAAGHIENTGKIQSTQTASIAATSLDNRGGKLQATSDLDVTLGSGALDNRAGLLDTSANLRLQAAGIDNRDTGASDQGLHGATISMQAQSLDNQRGSVLASQSQTLRTERSLDNSGGVISAAGDLSISGSNLALTNTGGQIQTNAALQVQAASISNTGTSGASQGLLGKRLTLDADVIDNRRGKLRAEEALAIRAATSVDNSAGAISASAGVSIQDRVDAPPARRLSVRNDGGLIETANALDIKAAGLSNTDTGGTSQGLRATRISIDADRIDNTRGAILANDSTTVSASGSLDNSAGTVSAGGALRIADRNADSASGNGALSNSRSLAITNTGGKLDAGTTSIDAAALGGDGQVLSQQATTVKLTGGFSNSGTVRSNGSIDIDSGGTLANDGLMQAATLLRIKAPTIMNGAGGTLVGNRLQLNATDAHTLLNRGLIDAQETVIVTQTLRNLGTGRIFGDHVAIAATTVDNEAETVNGGTSAPVIAARDRLDIGAENVNNREHAMLFAGGDMAIGGALDAGNRATGQAGTVNNNSATIEAQGALDLSARTINNTNEHFSTEVVEVSREQKREFQYSGSATRYDNSQVAIINDEADDMWLRDANGNPSVKLGNDFNRYDYTRVIQESRVSQSDPARIWSGQGLRIRADVLNNDKSQIIAGGTLTGAIGTLNNTEVPGQRIITDSGTAFHFYNIEKKGRDEQGVSSTAYYPGQIVQAISLTPTVYQQNTAVAGSGTQVGRLNNAAMANGVRVPGVALAIGGGGAIRLPDNSLFSINTNPALHYLVQSDPRFTNYRTWLSSDYMLQQLNVDPTLTQKRLGDGFYEQKLVREQVAELTGRRFLDGYSTDEAQYRALLEAGVTVARQYNLKVGVELSAAQIAALTADVVLLVEKDVVLPDGSTTRALVPQLYVRLKDGDINGHGALLAADSINLKISDSANNSGTIAGRNLLTLDAATINNNGGRLTAKDATVVAALDVNNIGGTIDAGDKLSVSAGRDLNLVTTTRDTATDQATRTSVERVAALYVTNPGGTLTATAARDINAKGAQIANSGEGGSTTLAAGNNVNVDTVTEKSTQSLRWDANNYRKEAMSSEVGSTIAAAGDVRVMAGNDINARGLNATSDKGAINLAAANNVNLGTAESRQQVDEGHQTSGSSGWLSKKTVTTRDQVDQSQASGSTVSGNTVSVAAGKDVNVTGSNVVSTRGTQIAAAGDVNIVAASDKSDSTHVRNEVTSGLFSGGGFGVTIGKQEMDNKNRTVSSTAVSSTVGSTEGNVSISAGSGYKQVGSNVMAPKGDIDILARQISILAATDSERNTQDVVFKQSGLTLQITSPVLSAIQTVQQMKKAAEKTTDGRMQALAGVTGGLAASNAYDAVKAGQGQTIYTKDAQGNIIDQKDGQIVTGENPDGTLKSRDANAADKVGGINLSISLGASKNESHAQSSASTARGSTVAAGGNVNLTATGGGVASNIVVQGSDIKAGVNATLKADNEVRLEAAQSTTEQHSTNKGMSGAIGVSIGTSGLLFTASASGSRGHGDGSDVTQVNTHVGAGNKLTIVSGTDTTIKGAVVSGKQVVMDVGTSGRGNLNIESLQDTSTYKSNQQSLGGSISVGMGQMSGSINYSKSSTNSNYASVMEQSGVKTGDGGFQINVRGNTDLKGAVIASSDKAVADNKNNLSTQTLTQSDIKNSAEYDAQSVGIGIGYSTGKSNPVGRDQQGNTQTGGTRVPGADLPTTGKDGGFSATPPVVMGASGSSSSVTRSGISGGIILITDDKKQQELTGKTAEQTVASVNRDVSSDKDGSNSLKPIFDKEEIENRTAIAGAFTREVGAFLENRAKESKEAQKELDNELSKPKDQQDVVKLAKLEKTLSDNDKWEMAGTGRLVLTAVSGGIGGNVAGSTGSFLKSAAAYYFQGLATQEVKGIADLLDSDSARAALQGLVACAGAAAQGHSCGAGATGAAASVVLNNLLNGLNGETASSLSQEERQSRKDLVASIVAGTSSVFGGDVVTSTLAAIIETENNATAFVKGTTERIKVAATSAADMLRKPKGSVTRQDVDSELAKLKVLVDSEDLSPQESLNLSSLWMSVIERAAVENLMSTQEVIGSKQFLQAAITAMAFGGSGNTNVRIPGSSTGPRLPTTTGNRTAVDLDDNVVFAQTSQGKNIEIKAADGVVASRINVRTGDANITGSGLEYAWKKHGGTWGANKSAFTIPKEELKIALQDPLVVNTPAYQSPTSGNYIRTVDMGRNIGIDAKADGQPTNFMTVITDSKGNLVNVFPGKTF